VFFSYLRGFRIWEELANASDGSLPRVDRRSDQPVCYSLALFAVAINEPALLRKTFYVKGHPRHPQVIFGFPGSNDRKTVIDRFLLLSFSFRSFSAERFALVFAPKRTSQTSWPAFTTINNVSFVNVNFNSSITK
jgi:hypothetical protein